MKLNFKISKMQSGCWKHWSSKGTLQAALAEAKELASRDDLEAVKITNKETKEEIRVK